MDPNPGWRSTLTNTYSTYPVIGSRSLSGYGVSMDHVMLEMYIPFLRVARQCWWLMVVSVLSTKFSEHLSYPEDSAFVCNCTLLSEKHPFFYEDGLHHSFTHQLEIVGQIHKEHIRQRRPVNELAKLTLF